tara:strand:+ start:454 stop:693 length:240 start_codon:yes stop_codon:yes gene_type:complete
LENLARQKVLDILSARTEHTVTPDSTLLDLEIESLEIVEVIFEIEEQLNIEMPYNANQEKDYQTVEDVLTVVERLVAEN